jgi:DNA invertase Pin-like site-specific DNA recombinase
MLIGYARVSSSDQNEARQIEEFKQLGTEKNFIDKQSGRNCDRPQLKEMLSFIRSGDTLVIESYSRLARSTADLIKLVEEITTKGAKITFQKENMTFTPNKKDPFQNLMLSMLGAINQFYRENLLEIQREGIRCAKLAGKYAKKRKKKLSPEQINEIKEKMKLRETNVSALAREFGVSRCLLYQLAKN